MLLHTNNETAASDSLAAFKDGERLDEALNAAKADIRAGRGHSVGVQSGSFERLLQSLRRFGSWLR